MFWHRQTVSGPAGVVEVAFTDRHGGVSEPPFDSLDLGGSATSDRGAEFAENRERVAAALDLGRMVAMHQVHGRDVAVLERAAGSPGPCDGLVTALPGVGLLVRAADCVPVVLADADHGVVGVAHAGRAGVAAGVVESTVAAMRSLGAEQVTAWIGPHVCGGCYEVPAALRDEVAAIEPGTFGCTRWGTPSLDLTAGVLAQLHRAGCITHRVEGCTRESRDLYSYRRDGPSAGRLGGVVALHIDEVAR